MQADPSIEITLDTIGDVEQMIVWPNPILRIRKKGQHYFLCEQLLNQITIDELAIMISTLRDNRHFVFDDDSQNRISIFEDLLLLCYLKLNQHQFCIQTMAILFKALQKFLNRGKKTLVKRLNDLKKAPFRFIWEAFQKNHDLKFRLDHPRNMRQLTTGDPVEHSVFYNSEQKTYIVSIENNGRKGASIPKINTLSFEQMGFLESIFLKNDIRNQAPKRMKSQKGRKALKMQNYEEGCKQEEKKNQVKVQKKIAKQKKKQLRKKCQAFAGKDHLIPFTLETVGDINAMRIKKNEFKKSGFILENEIKKVKIFLSKITKEQLSKMLIFLKDPQNRRNWQNLCEYRLKINHSIYFHLFEYILLFSLLKINEEQLTPANYWGIIHKIEIFLQRCIFSIKMKIDLLTKINYDMIWQAIEKGLNILPRNNETLKTFLCNKKCCQNIKNNNICDQKRGKNDVFYEEKQKSVKQEQQQSRLYQIKSSLSVDKIEKEQLEESYDEASEEKYHEQQYGYQKQEDFSFEDIETYSQIDCENHESYLLSGNKSTEDDQISLFEDRIITMLRENLQFYEREEFFTNPEIINNKYLFRYLDNEEYIEVKLKSVLTECMKLALKNKPLKQEDYTLIQQNIIVLKEIYEVESRKKVLEMENRHREEMAARQQKLSSQLKVYSEVLKSQEAFEDIVVDNEEDEEAQILKEKFDSIRNLGQNMNTLTGILADTFIA